MKKALISQCRFSIWKELKVIHYLVAFIVAVLLLIISVTIFSLTYLLFVPILNVKGFLCFFNFLIPLKCTHMPSDPESKKQRKEKQKYER